MFFFFKQKTAYEIYQCDWSSDVCSSDLEITQAVKQQTGRDLDLRGDIKLSVFPWLGLELGDTRLSNAPGFGKKPFVKIERVGVKVKLLPLLRSQVIVDKIILDGLQLNLARNQKGVTNWDDLLQPEPAAGKKRSEEHTSELQSH